MTATMTRCHRPGLFDFFMSIRNKLEYMNTDTTVLPMTGAYSSNQDVTLRGRMPAHTLDYILQAIVDESVRSSVPYFLVQGNSMNSYDKMIQTCSGLTLHPI
jgi:hypothetical protein